MVVFISNSNNIENILFERINRDTSLNEIAQTYKSVFSGAPWYEEFYCKNCQLHYTHTEIYPAFQRENLKKISKKSEILKCEICQDNLIEFYPGVINHFSLIDESRKKNGFIGYLAINTEKKLVGFSWGYKIPIENTSSVDFTKVNKMLEQREIDITNAFYAAEIGVIESYQRNGLGLLLSAMRSKEASISYKYILTRTINKAIHNINKKLFSGKEGVFLFEDPKNKTPWYLWNFYDFNYGEKII